MTDWPTVCLTAVLVGVTGYYAWQNKRMVDEIRRQNRPYVYIVYERGALVIHNAGSRSAHRIAIKVLRDTDLLEGEFRDEHGKLTLGLAKVSTSRVCHDGIKTLVPGASRSIGRAAYTLPDQPARLEYLVSYLDGASTKYEEELSEEYET